MAPPPFPAIDPTPRAATVRAGGQDSVVHGAPLPELDIDSLLHRFAEIIRRNPAGTAVIDGARHIDYDTLDRASDALADALDAAGTKHGDRVGLLIDRSAEAVVATLAIMKCGAACMPFDPRAPSARHAEQAASGSVRVLLVAPGGNPPDWFPGTVLPAHATAHAHARATPRPLPALVPEDIAYVIHTSGSTGVPKGVRLAHRGLLDLFRSADDIPLAPGDVVHHGMSIAFDGAVFEQWLALFNGAALSILPPDASIPALCAQVERDGTTTMLLSTGLFNTLTDDALRRLSRLRTLVVGGDVLAPAAAARFLGFGGRRLVNVYGPTEVSVFSHRHVLQGDSAPESACGEAVPIGRPHPGASAYVLDDALEPVPIGVEGELYIGGSGVAHGYLAAPALTDERFLPDPFRGGHARMYRSGDLVRQRADGALDFVGRIDGQVKINGFRVEPDEIERAFCAGGALVSACVVHVKTAGGRAQLHAFAVRAPACTDDADVLLSRLHERLPAYMVPRSLRFLDALPLTLNGKVDRRALAALCTTDAPAPEPGADHDGVSDPAEADDLSELLALLADCLGVPGITTSDNFYAVGGDSLSAMRFCARVEETRGITLPMTTLFETDTLGEALSAIVDTSRIAAV